MSEPVYDLISLGSGPGGNAAAQQVAHRGGRSCVIERKHLGGTCLNVGCMPTKALLAAGDAAWSMQHTETLGIEPGAGRVNGPAVMKRVHHVVQTLRSAMEEKMAGLGRVDVVRGTARLLDRHTVQVTHPSGTTQNLRGENLCIATGARAICPDVVDWNSPRMLTSEEALGLDDLPGSLVVMGGGIIGCEFATAYAELGVRVTVLEMFDRLVPMLAGEASSAAAALLAEGDVEIVTGQKVVAETDAAGAVRAELDDQRSFLAERCLVSVGRAANVEGIGLDAVGLSPTEEGFLEVDERCRTAVEGIYAVGDVAENRQYAHLAGRMGEVAGDNAMGVETADDRTVVPSPVFTHPQIGSVGLSEDQARRQYGEPVVLQYDYSSSGVGLLYNRPEGQLKLIAEPDTHRLLGALWICRDGVELLHEIALAIRNGLTIEDVYRTIHAHPCFAESLRTATERWLAGQADDAS